MTVAVSKEKPTECLTVDCYQCCLNTLPPDLPSFGVISAFNWCANRPEAEIAVSRRCQAGVVFPFDRPTLDCF
jgi:hypothetical protein